MNQLNEAQRKIKAMLLAGIRLTTAQANRQAQTVDARKIIPRLRKSGMEIKSFWNERDGRRWKTYYYESPLPAKGSKMEGFGEPKLNIQ